MSAADPNSGNYWAYTKAYANYNGWADVLAFNDYSCWAGGSRRVDYTIPLRCIQE